MLTKQPLQESKSLLSTTAAISICFLGSALWMSQVPHNVQWGDEPLIVFDHISQIKNGASISSLNYARIPSLFPDYILAYITGFFAPSIRHQYFWFTLLTGGLQILMMSGLVKQITKSNLIYSSLLVSTVGYTLGAINENIAFNLSFARYPVNHGGNLILVLLAANLFLTSNSLPSRGLRLIMPAGQAAINFFAIISNRIFVPQATIPLIIGNVYRFTKAPKNGANRKQFAVSIASITASALLAFFVSKFAISTGCTPPISTSVDGFQAVIQEMFNDKNTLAASSGFIICLGLLLPILLPAKGKDTAAKKNEYLVFSLSSTLITFTLWSLLWRNEPTGTYYNRYIFNLYGFALVGFSLSADQALCLARLKNINIKLLSFVALFTGILAAQSNNLSESFRVFSSYSNPYVELIGNPTGSKGKTFVLTDQQGPKGSRGIKAHTNGRIWASSISSDGSPNPWDQGKSEFRKRKSRDINDYSIIMTSPTNTEKMIERYGEPQKVTTDEKLGVSLLIYSTQESLAGIKKSIKRSLRGEFKIQCPSPFD